jgi:hypothetical protein
VLAFEYSTREKVRSATIRAIMAKRNGERDEKKLIVK